MTCQNVALLLDFRLLHGNSLCGARVLHVLTLVEHQVVLLEEGAIALAADVRPHSAFAVRVALVVQLQAVLGGEAFIAVLTEMCFRFGLVRLVVNYDLMRLLLLLLLLLWLSLRLNLILLHNLDRAHRRVLVLARDGGVHDGLLLRHLDVALRVVLLEHRRRNALNLLDDLLSIGLRDNLHRNGRSAAAAVRYQGGTVCYVVCERKNLIKLELCTHTIALTFASVYFDVGVALALEDVAGNSCREGTEVGHEALIAGVQAQMQLKGFAIVEAAAALVADMLTLNILLRVLLDADGFVLHRGASSGDHRNGLIGLLWLFLRNLNGLVLLVFLLEEMLLFDLLRVLVDVALLHALAAARSRCRCVLNASRWLNVVNYSLMRRQFRFCSETLTAVQAGMRCVSVLTHMCHECTLLKELLATHGALVWNASVQLAVVHQLELSRERGAAVLAHERIQTAVEARVHHQMLLLSETKMKC